MKTDEGKSILILEDNDERIAAFEKTVASLKGEFELRVWRDAPTMIAECESFFPTAREVLTAAGAHF